MENEYPIHKKYNLQDVHAIIYKVIVKAPESPEKTKKLTSISRPSSTTTGRTNIG